MPKYPKWRRLLDESRRQALIAVDFYNLPGDEKVLSDFIVHIHLAWQKLFSHPEFEKTKTFIIEKGGVRGFSMLKMPTELTGFGSLANA